MSCLSWLPNLEEIDISAPYLNDKDEQSMKIILKKLVELAPNVRKVTVKTVENLALYPEKVYGLLDELEFRLRSLEDLDLYRKVIEKRAGIRELLISTYQPPSLRDFGDSSSGDYDSDGSDNDDDGDNVERNFHHTLQLFLLNCCSQSLRKMEIQWVNNLDYGLSFPLLVNLKRLTYTNHFTEDFQGLWSAIVSVDYDQSMPNLEQLKIVINTVNRGSRTEVMEIADSEWPDNAVPDLDLELPPRPCSTSSSLKLKLELEMKAIDWSSIHSQFPNIPCLHVQLDHTSVLGSEPCPVSEICRLWPDLQELEITGLNNELGRNYDTDFCGIHEEGVELLRGQSKKYLKNVQIVPIRSCLLTMPSKSCAEEFLITIFDFDTCKTCINFSSVEDLRKVCISLGLKRRASQQDGVQDSSRPLQFISRVTRLVTLGKMENAAVWDYSSSSYKSDSDVDETESEGDVELLFTPESPT